MLSKSFKLIDIVAPVVVAKDVGAKGAKEYMGFEDYFDVLEHILDTPKENRNFYEVLQGLEPRRIYFDVDKKKVKGEELPDVAEFVFHMKDTIINVFDVLCGIELSEDEILFTESSTKSKFSFHIVVPDYKVSVEVMKLIHKFVSDTMEATNANYKDIVDPAVYGRNQCFRLLHCCKNGKKNYKKLYTGNFTECQTLVGDISECKSLKLVDRIQKSLDEKKEAYEARHVNYACDSTHDKEFFTKLVDGLKSSRAENYVTWRNVCMSLGHEKAGLDIAIRFSNKTSKKSQVNRAKTTELYEVGLKSTFNGRALGVGTLLHYLREDNYEVFKALTMPKKEKEDSPNLRNMIECMKEGLNFEDGEDEVEEEDYFEEKEEEKKEKKETQEDKLKRWLSRDEFYLRNPVSDPTNLIDFQKQDIYETKYMKEYPKDAKTLIVKAQKGRGKTHTLVDYIKEQPELKRIIFISFRRSFTGELMKRLTPLGFKKYSDIKGAINDDNLRLVIQVESLHRIKWTEKADLVVCDEIESIRSQHFSPTNKFRARVMEKYRMFIKTSEKSIFMDADISENTVKHIFSLRDESTTQYIENIYTEEASKYKEFYSTKINTVLGKICESLSNGQKIVIASNRSVKFQLALVDRILKAYPALKIGVYNSKTIREKKVAKELKDVEIGWSSKDVIIYSPTISAGVSFDSKRFDTFYGFFVNNGKINSMRQMISRVRHFSTNEYYFCLQSFGGSSKPQNAEEFEQYICSNRFITDGLPAFIHCEESYDGTRSYPYKTMGYDLWVMNEIEIARDKCMFLYNFLREQYQSGTGSMKWFGTETTTENEEKQKIKKTDIKDVSKKIEKKECEAIADAKIISKIEKEEIEAKLRAEIQVSEDDLLSLQRYNLLEWYDFKQTEKPNWVWYILKRKKRAKETYKNRKIAFVKGNLRYLKEQESEHFSRVCGGDEVAVEDDLRKKYRSVKITIGLELLKIVGIKKLSDKTEITRKALMQRFQKNEKKLIKKMPHICSVFGIRKRSQPKIEEWGKKVYFKKMLRFINDRLLELFDMTLKETGNHSKKYELDKRFNSDEIACFEQFEK